ncbi:MAG: hypothetical protein GWN14_15440, partial [candidate division Zixibacteria bacterium]|nr:hypothetical protein [candidate division Zixibacteria bacterium]
MNIRKYLIIFLGLIYWLAACHQTLQPTPTPEPIIPPEIQMTEVTIYFLDESRFAVGAEPYENGVTRSFHPDAFLPRLALQAYFDGPREDEAAQGLSAPLSGCTGFSEFS